MPLERILPLHEQKQPLDDEVAKPEALAIWTLYDHPIDFPEFYAARETIVPGYEITGRLILMTDVDAMHKIFIERGLHWIPRYPDDDRVILGTYV